jgi:hypothetical protein
VTFVILFEHMTRLAYFMPSFSIRLYSYQHNFQMRYRIRVSTHRIQRMKMKKLVCSRTVELLVERSGGKILIEEILSPKEFALSFIASQVSRRTRELGYPIIRCFNSPTFVQDMEILKHDERFKRLGKETDEEFKDCYSRFVGSMREN